MQRGINEVMGSNQVFQPNKNLKLFVFGDNYADTGNMRHGAVSWKSPYGFTFPGKPSGRYSDGLIATDFLAKVLGAKSPHLWRTHGRSKLKLNRGMNFAFGGSGVYDSPAEKSTNMSIQVSFLVDLFLAGRVYTYDDLSSSDVALLSYSGNDYFGYIAENPKFAAYPAFVQYIVDDIKQTLWKLDGLKFKNIAVTSLQPIGCIPHYTAASSFKSCNESYSELVELHNRLLKNVVAKLNEEARLRKKGQRNFFIIDIHKAFMTVLKKKGENPKVTLKLSILNPSCKVFPVTGSTRFKDMLKPCCDGDCANVDSKGAKKYSLCDDPKSAFFWDDFNPTQEGWKSIYSVLGNPLTKSTSTKG
ncbi:unnamed protein product [Thlaspi arvense]|uniref:GDSL esterase/lipase n=1 Tax=Thlaspi arvense TaxID=13288 RepID=A0AAU9T0Z9_THLAR|nr:unnamed protein product [Thlaspi arvense]